MRKTTLNKLEERAAELHGPATAISVDRERAGIVVRVWSGKGDELLTTAPFRTKEAAVRSMLLALGAALLVACGGAPPSEEAPNQPPTADVSVPSQTGESAPTMRVPENSAQKPTRVSADASADGDTTAEAGPALCSPNLALVGSCTASDGTCVETWDGSGAPKTPACAGAWSAELCPREHFIGICSEPQTPACVTTRTIYYAGDAPTLEAACNAVPGATFVLPNHP